MKSLSVCLLGLLVFVSVGTAEPSLVVGQVRLSDGQAVAGAQVALFDLANLRRGAVVQATTDAAGQFALPLAALGRSGLSHGFGLGSNYPNPFNPGTVIPYQLAAAAHVRLEVFNLLGQWVATLVEGARPAGAHTARWDGTDVAGRAAAAGVYVYRLTVDGASQTGRMVLVDGQAGVPIGGAEVKVQSPAAVGGSAYGLVVVGEGMVPYVDAAFRVEAGSAAIELVVEGSGELPRMKVAAGGLLGDVDNNEQVNIADALLVMAYSLGASGVMPNGGDIGLGDVDGDGSITVTDAWLIATYVVNSSDPRLPAGIGLPADHGGEGGEELVASLPGGASMEFVWIEPGTFQMGSPASESGHSDDEGPVHEVEISEGFWLGKYEVTQGQWKSVMGRAPWSGEDFVIEDPSHPAVYIFWYEVQVFIGELNEAAGDSLYRLPTEAEWEYACRAGSTTRWSFGDDTSQLTHYGWYGDNAWDIGETYAHAVGLKRPNAWGLYDMHGNVWEWVQDRYDADYYNSSPRVDPPGPSSGSNRVIRGGGFFNSYRRLRSAARESLGPGAHFDGIGVRLLRIR